MTTQPLTPAQRQARARKRRAEYVRGLEERLEIAERACRSYYEYEYGDGDPNPSLLVQWHELVKENLRTTQDTSCVA
jgi:hypothetical protein